MGKNKVFEIICGTYEEYLLGFIFNSKSAEFRQSFAAHDHSGSIRTVACSENFLASGGTDDRIVVYDLKTRREHCMLTQHDATVNCVQFTENNSHVMSGSSDGVLSIVRVGNWQLEKLWEKPHKGSAVLDIAMHSSGKLALTLGGDHSLSTWNLVKGRQAYVINLNTKCKDAKSIEKITWAPDSVRFVLYGGKYTEIWSIDSGGPLKQIDHSEKVVSCIWLDDTSLLVGYENGYICKLEVDSNERTVKQAHQSRVKGLAAYKHWFVTGSSNGEVKVWNTDMEEIVKHNTGCRLTCMCIVPQIHIKEEKVEEEENVAENVQLKNPKPNKRGAVVVIEEEEDSQVHKPKRHKKKKKHVKT